jgi:hypothetical protein
MNDTLIFIFSLSIGIAAIIGVVRFNNIDKSYYPFIYSVWASLLVELTVRALTISGASKAVAVFINFYFLVDFYLFFLLFKNWHLFGYSKRNPQIIIVITLLVWIGTTFFINGINQPNFYFPILYSFALVFFSVTTFNKFIVHERANIFTNARFLICLGIIIFYTFFILTNTSAALTIFKNNVTSLFRRNLQGINVYTNLLVNIIYAIAVIWVPRKKNSITIS